MMTSVRWLGLAFLLSVSPVWAAEKAAGTKISPHIGGDVVVRFLVYNGIYESEANRIGESDFLESNDLFPEFIASPEFRLTDRFLVHSEIRMETIVPPAEDRYFENLGIFVRELYAQYTVDDQLSVHFGKYAPSFALASLITPGMFGNNYNKGAEFIERIGFGGAYTFDAGTSGKHKFSANTFFHDTSVLSDSLGTRRGRRQLEDGGASNTESFESFTISLEGSDISRLPGFMYKLGYVHQAKGKRDAGDENGFAVAGVQSFQLDDKKSLTFIGEVAPLWNYQGTADDIVFSSASMAYKFGRWSTVISGTHRWRDLAAGGIYNDYNLQTAVEYDLGNSFTLAVGHEFLRDRNLNSRRIGVRFFKTLDLER